jgi:glycosyltransferase involved in cell wall biosynthesis
VVVQLYEAAQFCPDLFDGPVILDFEDPPFAKLSRTAPWLGRWRRLLARIDHKRLIRYERLCARRFDRLVFVSERDAIEFGNTYGCTEKVRWVPHGVEIPPTRAAGAASRTDGMVVVTGNMAHRPNAVAAEFICREVFPTVRRAVPEATLWLVGAGPSKALRQHGRAGGITVTGWVPDVRRYLEQALVAVCGVPVVVGTQTKVLEALACGTPVVTTAAGNHGIEGATGEHLYVCDTAGEFADRITSLLRRERWTELSDAGSRFVRERFSANGTGAALEQVILEAIATRHLTDTSVTKARC